MLSSLPRLRDEDVLRLDITVDEPQRMKVAQSRGDLGQGALRHERGDDMLEQGILSSSNIHDVCQGCGAELERDVVKRRVACVVDVSDDVWVAAGLAEDA